MNIPTFSIVHETKTNLEYIPWEENLKKGDSCSISLEEFYKGVFDE